MTPAEHANHWAAHFRKRWLRAVPGSKEEKVQRLRLSEAVRQWRKFHTLKAI